MTSTIVGVRRSTVDDGRDQLVVEPGKESAQRGVALALPSRIARRAISGFEQLDDPGSRPSRWPSP